MLWQGMITVESRIWKCDVANSKQCDEGKVFGVFAHCVVEFLDIISPETWSASRVAQA